MMKSISLDECGCLGTQPITIGAPLSMECFIYIYYIMNDYKCIKPNKNGRNVVVTWSITVLGNPTRSNFFWQRSTSMVRLSCSCLVPLGPPIIEGRHIHSQNIHTAIVNINVNHIRMSNISIVNICKSNYI